MDYPKAWVGFEQNGAAYAEFLSTGSTVYYRVKNYRLDPEKVGELTVSLQRGWVQEIKRMYPVLLMHGLFLT